jgi:putative SOS response-associated peptidase YedK
MCFSVNVNLIKEELEKRYDATLTDPDNYRPSYYYHAFSLPKMPVVCSEERKKIQLYQWGLIPSWTSNADEAGLIRYKTFNARAETITEKPSFSSPFTSRRCIIPVKGFFEWQHRGKEKIPWYIYHADNEILSLAGLYEKWQDNSSGEIFNTFTIITSEANEMMGEIHNSAKRMPVILSKEGETIWMEISSPSPDLHELLKPCPAEILNGHTVGSLINNNKADRNTPEIIKPHDYSKGNLLFDGM